MIDRHWDGIAAYWRPENKVSRGFVEGLNNKIRVIQRRAYGLRDEDYLRLKVLTCMLPQLSPKHTSHTGYPPAPACLQERRPGRRPWITLRHTIHPAYLSLTHSGLSTDACQQSPTRFREEPILLGHSRVARVKS
jgi:hypothetical protein